ncbi:MBL fold metallo-hydrolase, partial [Klebsiella pneumoniae]
ATVAYIAKSRAPKLAYWGPILKDSAPARTLVPEVLQGNALELEGQRIEVVGHDQQHTSLWIPSIKAVVGGVVVSDNIHLWMADTQGAQSHADWLGTLQRIEKLKPVTVVPGHY